MSAFIKNTSAVLTSGGIKQPIIEGITYSGYTSGTNPVVFKTKDSARSNDSKLISGTTSRFTALQECNVVVTASIDISGSGSYYGAINHYDVSGNTIKGASLYGTSTQADISVPLTTKASIGDYFIVQTNGTPLDNTSTFFCITATGIEATQPNFVVSLPTSKENNFSAVIASAGALTSDNVNWINSITLTDTSLYTIDITRLGLTKAPAAQAQIERTLTIGATNLGADAFIVSTSPTQIVVRTAVASGSGNVAAFASALPFKISIQKQSPDYTAPGAFVGNVQPDWQYDLTVTGDNSWSTIRAVATISKMGGGQYKMNFIIVGSSSSVSSINLTISGVVFKNVSSYNQGLSGESAGQTLFGRVNPNAATMTVGAPSNTSVWRMFGDVELESKPAWATFTI
jgi:hypothetical protein